MSAVNQIERLRELVRKCYATVAGKNGTVPEVGERNMENLPAAIESVPSPVKVKVGSFTITNECIGNDGKIVGESSIDTSELNTFSFYGCSAVKKIEIKNLVGSKNGDLYTSFRDCTSLEEIKTDDWDTSAITRCIYTFQNTKIKTIDTSGWDFSNITSWSDPFIECKMLTSIVGNKTLDDVVNNDVKALRGIKINFGVFRYSPNIDMPSLRAILNGLPEASESRTLSLNGYAVVLTEEDIAIATAKNWTIA